MCVKYKFISQNKIKINSVQLFFYGVILYEMGNSNYYFININETLLHEIIVFVWDGYKSFNLL